MAQAKRAKLTKVTVVYERVVAAAGGGWVASVKELPRCLARGKTLAQARARIVEALTQFPGEVSTAVQIADAPKLPAPLLASIHAAAEARREAEAAVARASELMGRTVRDLVASSLSPRDVAELLGVSPERIERLAARARPSAAKRERPRAAGPRSSRAPAPSKRAPR